MKIGLLTTYSFNYGSYHQAVALQKKLEDLGHECELINEKTKMFKWPNLTFLYLFDPILPGFMKKLVAKKIPQYNSYIMIKNDIATLSVSPAKILNFSVLSKRYDCIIVGSDELWSANSDSIRFCPEYFGIGIDCPLISYATCAIKLDDKNNDINQQINSGLSKFTAISVRDKQSLENVKKIAPQLSIDTVIDPTLLNPYFVPQDEVKSNKKYVLLYGQHFDEDQRAFIKEHAKKHNAAIYSIGWEQDFADDFLNVTSAEDLQKAFAAAEFCFPSTFHGTIFSILNHRQFVSMLNPLRGKKVELLLELLGLENRIYTNGANFDTEINYTAIEERLAELRALSEEFLITALDKVAKDE